MAVIPLPTGMAGKKGSPKQRESLINAYYKAGNIGTVMTRPGVYKAADGFGKCRGSGKFKEELYQVTGTKLIKITTTSVTKKTLLESDVVIDEIGTIEGGNNCILVAGFTELCILVITSSIEIGKAYIYNTSSGLREITDPSFQPSVSVDYDAGRFIFIPFDGGPFFWTELADPASILPQSYADAEEFPDPNLAVKTYRQSIDILGSRSIERLDYIPNVSSYARIGGISSNVGYVGGLTDYGETYAFIGVEDGGFSIYVMGQGPTKIENDYIDELLSGYTQEQLTLARSDTFNWNGQIFALFHLENHVISLYGGSLALWHSDVTANDTGVLSWGFVQAAYGYIWAGGILTTNIGILSDDAGDFGELIESEMVTFYRSESRSNDIIKRIYIDSTVGNGAEEIEGSFSRDGVIYGQVISRPLGKIGDYGAEVSWGPIGMIDNFLGIRFRWTGNIGINADAVIIQ